MENNKLVILFSVCLFFLAFPVFAYDNITTHPKMTEEVIKLFNQTYPNLKLSAEEIASIKQGSADEDSGARSVKHFYDPVYNRGILGFETSKDWSNDTPAQGGFVIGPNNILAGTVTSYFSADSDYTWDRAVFDYVHGDKNRGLEALGHVVHLVEDATVPDHTRNDNHLPYLKNTSLDQTSPYEVYTTDPADLEGLANKLMTAGEKPVIYSSLGQYFDSLAEYSNSNFFSRDTTPDKSTEYNGPKIEKVDNEPCIDSEDGCFFVKENINGENIRLALETRALDKKTNEIIKTYSIMDKKRTILSDYWSHLSRQAVLNSAGVIKLFFDQVAQEKLTNALFDKNKSYAQRLADSLLGLVGSGSSSSTPSNPNDPSLKDSPSGKTDEDGPSDDPNLPNPPADVVHTEEAIDVWRVQGFHSRRGDFPSGTVTAFGSAGIELTEKETVFVRAVALEVTDTGQIVLDKADVGLLTEKGKQGFGQAVLSGFFVPLQLEGETHSLVGEVVFLADV